VKWWSYVILIAWFRVVSLRQSVLLYVSQAKQQLDKIKRKTTHASGGGAGSGAVQQSPSSFIFIVFWLELDGSQPDVLAVRVRLKCQRQDTSSVDDVALHSNQTDFITERQLHRCLCLRLCVSDAVRHNQRRLFNCFTLGVRRRFLYQQQQPCLSAGHCGLACTRPVKNTHHNCLHFHRQVKSSQVIL